MKKLSFQTWIDEDLSHTQDIQTLNIAPITKPNDCNTDTNTREISPTKQHSQHNISLWRGKLLLSGYPLWETRLTPRGSIRLHTSFHPAGKMLILPRCMTYSLPLFSNHDLFHLFTLCLDSGYPAFRHSRDNLTIESRKEDI
jgi:hypothetical protein